MAGPGAFPRRDIIARAVSRNLSILKLFAPSAESVIHANRGTSVAGDRDAAIIAPVPIVVPVINRVPIASFA
jgi:hypothetical protein